MVTAVRSQARMEASKSIPFPSKGSRRGSKEKGRGWSRSAQRVDQAGTYHTPTPGTCNEWGWKHPWEPNQHSPAASGNASHQQYRRSHLLDVSRQAQLLLHGAHLEVGCSGIPHGPTGGDLYYRGRTTGIFPAESLRTGCPCSSTSALWHSGDRGKLGQRPSNGLTALHKDPPGACPSGKVPIEGRTLTPGR